MLEVRQKLKLCGFAIGIFCCFAIFGLVQEQVFRGRYGDEISADGMKGERYTMPITFGAVQCIFFVLFAKGDLLLCDKSDVFVLLLCNIFNSSINIHTQASKERN